jgi:hypothetical protein
VLKSKLYEASGKRGRVSVDIVSVVMDGGVVITLAGGDLPHIGAVALAEPRPSRIDSKKTSSSVSVLVRLGHKEDELAKRLAGEVAASLGLPVVLSVGIHVDDASAKDIEETELLASALVMESVPRIRSLLSEFVPRKWRPPRSLS